jgi:maltose alpha-D-glucosyltransferase/alpha-amylase
MPFAVARVRRGARVGLLFGAASSQDFTAVVLDAMREGTEIKTDEGNLIRFAATSALDAHEAVDPAEVRRLSAEQSNTSIAIGQRMMLKLYRRLQPGIHPEIEVGRFLTEVAGFRNTPALLGYVEHVANGRTRTALAVLQSFVPNQGDAWSMTLDALRRELDTLALLPAEAAPPLEQAFATYLPYAEILGRRTAEMHLAFATPTDDVAFAAEPFGEKDLATVVADARTMAQKAFGALNRIEAEPGSAVAELKERRDACMALIDRLAEVPTGAIKTRVHGDYHLGQVLVVENDVMIVDFEGEPSRRASERRAKSSPWRDVAGMLRSFDYAAATAAREIAPRFSETEAERVLAAAHGWRDLTRSVFMKAYEATVRGSPVWIEDEGERGRLLRLHVLAKALYEINYEANNRPDWIETPVRGVLSIMDEESA